MWSRADHDQCPNCKPETLKSGGVTQVKKVTLSDWCAVHDEPRPCPACNVLGTGTTIEEEQAKVKSIGDYRDAIIEGAVEMVNTQQPETCVGFQDLSDAVDAYHAELRRLSREGK